MHINTHTWPLPGNIARILLACIALIFCSSCEKDQPPVPLNIAAASFGSASYTIERNSTDPITIAITLSLPLEEEGTIVIEPGDNSTATADQYTTNPAASSGAITLTLPKDATEASFILTSENNFADDVHLEFVITAASGGIQLAKDQASTLVTMKGNNPTTPELTTSLTSLEDFGLVDIGDVSESKSFTISSRNLTQDIEVAVSDYFEISADDVTFSKTLTIDYNDTNLSSAEVFVRFAPLSGLNQGLSGFITVSTPQVAEESYVTLSGQESGNAQSTFLINDDFEYGNTGDDITKVSGWTLRNASTTRPVQYIPTGLSLPGFPSAGGAVTMNNGANCNVGRDFDAQSSGVIYTSVMVNISAAPSGAVFFFSHMQGGSYFNRLYARDNNGMLELGIARGGTEVEYSSKILAYNTPYLAVIKYDFAAQKSSLYILDGSTVALSEPGAADASSQANTAPTSLETVIIRQSSGIFTATLDAIRISTSWRGAIGF